MNNEVNKPLLNEENDIYPLSTINEKDSGVFYNDFDYEIDKPIDPTIFQKINSFQIFPDNLAEKYYKCEPISIFSRN